MTRIYIIQDSEYVRQAFNKAYMTDYYKRIDQGETYMAGRWALSKLETFKKEHEITVIQHHMPAEGSKSGWFRSFYEIEEEDFNLFLLLNGPLYRKCNQKLIAEALKTYTAQVESHNQHT